MTTVLLVLLEDGPLLGMLSVGILNNDLLFLGEINCPFLGTWYKSF